MSGTGDNQNRVIVKNIADIACMRDNTLPAPEMAEYPVYQIDEHSAKDGDEHTAHIDNVLLHTVIGNPGMIDDLTNDIIHSILPPKELVKDKRKGCKKSETEDIVEGIRPHRTHRRNKGDNIVKERHYQQPPRA